MKMITFALMGQTIYEYFKKELPEATILVRIHPETLEGLELIVLTSKQIQQTVRQFDDNIYHELAFDKFIDGSAMEFNLYLKGLAGHK